MAAGWVASLASEKKKKNEIPKPLWLSAEVKTDGYRYWNQNDLEPCSFHLLAVISDERLGVPKP